MLLATLQYGLQQWLLKSNLWFDKSSQKGTMRMWNGSASWNALGLHLSINICRIAFNC